LAIIIGLMSGTSADGVDAAAFDIRPKKGGLSIRPVASCHAAYKSDLAEALTQFHPTTSANQAMELDIAVGAVFAKAAKKLIKTLALKGHKPTLIGSHGQTILHRPDIGATLQIGSAAHIAAITGVDVWSDFRRADMAVGGQGAPLAPVAHLPLFVSPRQATAVVNIGGIANITHVPAAAKGLQELIAFDTGPGNMLMDMVAQKAIGQPFDRNGRLAATGLVDQKILEKALKHSYFKKPPPKSTGRETFGQPFLDWLFPKGRVNWDANLCATMTELTAASVCFEINRLKHGGRPVDQIIVCGGGAKNGSLMKRLIQLCAPDPVVTSDKNGIAPMLVETALMAILTYHASRGNALDLSAVTGSKRPVKLGVFTPAP